MLRLHNLDTLTLPTTYLPTYLPILPCRTLRLLTCALNLLGGSRYHNSSSTTACRYVCRYDQLNSLHVKFVLLTVLRLLFTAVVFLTFVRPRGSDTQFFASRKRKDIFTLALVITSQPASVLSCIPFGVLSSPKLPYPVSAATLPTS